MENDSNQMFADLKSSFEKINQYILHPVVLALRLKQILDFDMRYFPNVNLLFLI